ncbi:MAG: RecX family transcriptional regulator [Archangium sp.]|nr:RecX family transcriptional regulator [Archangium sp.]
MRRISEQSLGNVALHYLRRYSATRKGLTQVLSRRVKRHARLKKIEAPADAAAMIDRVVERMVKSGYVDDRRLAENKHASLRRQGKSVRAIRLKLRVKGVPAELIAETTRSTVEDELEAASTLVRKKKLGTRPERRQKDLGVLVRAGFSYDVAKRSLAAAVS